MSNYRNIKYKKKHVLCTLFNSKYLDKGLVLYNTLDIVCAEFKLFVLAMDDCCYEILSDLNLQNLILIKLDDFESEELLVAKSNRPFGQYCWTCSSSLIKYVLDVFSSDYCTYIDADMAFYADPYVLVDELEDAGKDVSLVAHRFSWYDKQRQNIVGYFCVECNTFKNSSIAKQLLDIWIEKCLNDCSAREDGIHWGDQMYISDWNKKYDCVIESSFLGAGVAPWNISQYRLINDDTTIKVKCKGKIVTLLFYHFEGITSTSIYDVNIHVYSYWGIDNKLVSRLYTPYLIKLYNTKKILFEKYALDTIIKSHPALDVPREESSFMKFKRRIKSIFSPKIVGIIFHGIPNKIYGFKDYVNIEKYISTVSNPKDGILE